MSVKRYKPMNQAHENEHGAFVLWNDYEALRASHEALIKAIAGLPMTGFPAHAGIDPIDEALKPILFHRSGSVAVDAINEHLENVRAYLMRPKSPEERVTIHSDGPLYKCVHLDGVPKRGRLNKEDAEIYRLGLIATLKEEESHAHADKD